MIAESASCETDQDEYWYHVAAQEEMPLAGAARNPLVLSQLDSYDKDQQSRVYVAGAIDEDLIADWIYQNPNLVLELRLVLSISDKRLYLDLSYLFSRAVIDNEGTQTICGCLPNKMKKHGTSAIIGFIQRGPDKRRRRAAKVISSYLVAKGLLTVLDLYFGLSLEQRQAVNDLWLSPHNVQQNETKRRGHGAEGEIARVLVEAGVHIHPPNKHTDPMGAHDPNVSLESFAIVPRVAGRTISVDIAVLDAKSKLAAMTVGLVQSSDPGQFGVDKAATNRNIRRALDGFRRRSDQQTEFWGIVDGIGYAENPNGTINRMLEDFDCFIQLKSAYKAILRAGDLGLVKPVAIQYDMEFYSEVTRRQMHERYAGGCKLVTHHREAPSGSRPIRAGRAKVWIS